MASYLFLDVDGVLNPEHSFATDLDPSFRLHRINRFDVWVSEKQATWLRDLRRNGTTIVWATTWIENIEMLDELATILGLPLDMPRIDVMDYTSYKDCGKQPGIFRWLNKNNIDPDLHPCVWVDDLLGPNDKLWAKVLGIKAVHVNPAHGLASTGVISRIERGLKQRTRT
jgi:FMN phosphatase YigB (HAD superfamily)